MAGAQSWRSKRMRQRSDYLWRLIDRATCKTTPRGWFSHVAPLACADDGVFPPVLGEELGVAWTENLFVHRRTRARAALSDRDASVLLTLAPLHVDNGSHVTFWVRGADTHGTVNEVRLRRSPLLSAIMEALLPGAAALDSVLSAVAPGVAGAKGGVFHRFINYLADLGVVEASIPPRRRVGALSATHDPGAASRGYVDVYRQVTAPLPTTASARFERLVLQALRVLTVARSDGQASSTSDTDGIDENPRPVLSVLADRIRARPAFDHHHHQSSWPAPADQASAWARLVSWVGDHAEADSIDLTSAILDRLGLPQVAAVAWPCDVLLRPLAAGGAVLQTVACAGLLDARFVADLVVLYGAYQDQYGQFLSELERQAGGTFIELLVPPLSERTANAVRRPLRTCHWTGDADLTSYCERPPSSRYVPLDAITVRTAGEAIVAEADGRVLWPVHHATRTVQPPWHLLARLLIGSNPWLEQFPRLAYSLSAYPGRRMMPRITIDGGLVISCAQWRVPAQPWDPDAATWVKARAVERLRAGLGLPRFVYVSGQRTGPPRPCDLESLRAIRTLERAGRSGDEDLLLVEALPAPDRLPVQTRTGEGYAAELMLRLPHAEDPRSMAARIAGSGPHLPGHQVVG